MDSRSEERIRILVADDDEGVLQIFVDSLVDVSSQLPEGANPLQNDWLETTGFEVVTCQHALAAIEQVKKSLIDNKPFALAFLDIRLSPGPDVVWAAKEIRTLDREIELVLITGFSEVNQDQAIETIPPPHKILYLKKPLYPQEIYQCSVSLSEKWRTEKQLKAIKESLEQKVASRDRTLELLNQGSQSDATERKKMAEELICFRLAIDLSGEGIFIISSKTGNFLEVNERACVQLGYTYDELMQKTVMEIEQIFPTLQDFQAHAAQVKRFTGSYFIARGVHKRKDGTTYPVETSVFMKTIGKEEFLIATVKDTSDWRRVTDELTASKAHLAMAQQIAHLGSWEWDIKADKIEWSDESHRIFGYPPSDYNLSFDTIVQRIHPEDVGLFQDTIHRALEEKSRFDFVHRLTVQNGETKYIRERAKVFCDESGVPVKMVGTAQDVTRRRQDEHEMQHLRNLLSSIINSMPSILIGLDPEGKITQWNKEAQQFTGISSLKALNRPLEEVFPKLAIASTMVRQAIAGAKSLKQPKVCVEKDNKTVLFDITAYPLATDKVEGAVILVENVTEKVRMEEIMLQTEKMFTVGGLAAGMAHEINNPLAGIIQNLQVIRNRLSAKLPKNALIAKECGTSIEQIEAYVKKRKLQDAIEKVLEAGQRAAKIVENMLNFSYKAGTVYSMHNLADLLDKTVELACNEYDLKKRFDFRQVAIIKEYSKDAPKVPCEGNTIQQVFFNILKNGAHAMANNKNQADKPCFHLRVIPEANMVRVEIQDNGPGIDEQTQKRIFEPFFTTKEAGVGTGLGLAVSYFIITENHGGSIAVNSLPGHGATFIIRLPV
jgi:PAS domain S-box-containing protein